MLVGKYSEAMMKGMGWTPMSQKKRVAITHTIGTHVRLQHNTSLTMCALCDLCLLLAFRSSQNVYPSFHYYTIHYIITCRNW